MARLSRIYDDDGYPTNVRVDDLTGEEVYDAVEAWKCRGCGSEMHGQGWLVGGKAVCLPCWHKAAGHKPCPVCHDPYIWLDEWEQEMGACSLCLAKGTVIR